jgi:hypothetical protein
MDDETLVSNTDADIVEFSDTGSKIADYANSDIDHVSDAPHAMGSSGIAR